MSSIYNTLYCPKCRTTFEDEDAAEHLSPCCAEPMGDGYGDDDPICPGCGKHFGHDEEIPVCPQCGHDGGDGQHLQPDYAVCLLSEIRENGDEGKFEDMPRRKVGVE